MSSELIENIQDLYIGYINQPGHIRLGSQKVLEADFRGEILFHSDGQNGVVVQRLRRLALFGTARPFPNEDLSGLFSIAGPLELPQVTASPTRGSIEELVMEFNCEPSSKDNWWQKLLRFLGVSKSTEKQLLVAKVTWLQEDEPVNGATWKKVELTFQAKNGWVEKLVKPPVEQLELESPEIHFRPVGSEVPRGEPIKNEACEFILSHCRGGGVTACSPSHYPTIERRLPVKFINLAMNPGNKLNIPLICNQQIAGVREVWRNQAALELTVWPNEENYSDNNPSPLLRAGEIYDAPLPDKQVFTQIDVGKTTKLAEFRARLRTSQPDWGHIEIYLVDYLAGAFNGGDTELRGTADAFCILDLNKAKNNETLLAHELGHVLGLEERSGGCIMEDATSCLNSKVHCNFLATSCKLNPIVRHTTISDFFNPQG